jgi:hypothetical protein
VVEVPWDGHLVDHIEATFPEKLVDETHCHLGLMRQLGFIQ